MSRTIQFDYHFGFVWPLEIGGIHLRDVDLDGVATIVRYPGEANWRIEGWRVRGVKAIEYYGREPEEAELDIDPVFGTAQVVSIRAAMQRELARQEHQATITDMVRQMSGADALGEAA